MVLVQFSPSRSGSTLVYNYLLELGKYPEKQHIYEEDTENKYIITIRHPYNSIISLILHHDKEINVETIRDQMNMYLKIGGNDISENDFISKNHCILLYEDFLNNHDIILDKFESFFNEKYLQKERSEIKYKLSINSVMKSINEKNYTHPQYDKYTHFHSKHISKFNGNTDYKTLLNKDELSILEKNPMLTKIIQKYYK